MAEETAIGKPLEVYVSKTEQELLNGEPNVLGLSTDQDTIVFNNKVIGSGSGIRYKRLRIQAANGWYRFAQIKMGAEQNPTAIFGIDRSYSKVVDEHYVFASSLHHNKKGYITQLAGGYPTDTSHLVTKVRTAQKTGATSPMYLDFYVNEAPTNVDSYYYVWVLGNWDLLDIAKVDEAADTTNNITRLVEFETTNGFATSGDVNVARNITAQGDVKATDFIGNIPDTAVFSKELTAFNSLESPRLRSLNSQIRNNLLSFNGSALTAEYTIDGGSTWVDFELTDTRKQQFVTDGWELTNQLQAGNGDTTVVPQLKGVRLTYDFSAIANGSFYGNISDAIITINANSGTIMKVEVLDWKNNVWTEKGTYNLNSSDALPNAVYLGTLRFRRTSTTTSNQYKAIRFTFSYQGTETALTRIPFNVRSLKLFSNGWYSNDLPNYARYGHLYSTDSVQNMILPNGLLPSTTNDKNLGSASKVFNLVYANRLVGVADKAAADENGKNISNTYQRVATPIFGGIMVLGDRRLITSTYVGEATADKVFFLTDVFKFAYYVEGTDSFQSVFTNGANWRDYSNVDGTPIADKLYITPNGNVYAFYDGNIRPIKAKSISATKEYTTEVISIDADFNVTCLSNNAISTLPTNILNGVMYLKSNGAVKSTAIPLNLGTTSNYPIKYLNGTTWVDATILVRASTDVAQWFLTVPSDTPVSMDGLVLEGQITANFVEE